MLSHNQRACKINLIAFACALSNIVTPACTMYAQKCFSNTTSHINLYPSILRRKHFFSRTRRNDDTAIGVIADDQYNQKSNVAF